MGVGVLPIPFLFETGKIAFLLLKFQRLPAWVITCKPQPEKLKYRRETGGIQ